MEHRTGQLRILVVGCGLMGTSFAMAVKHRCPEMIVDGVELHPENRAVAAETGTFREIVQDLDDPVRHAAARYDWVILATPVDAAIRQLPAAADIGRRVMDICSVKRGICDAADALGLRDRFVPTHPMTGLAASGPSAANPDLFAGARWITFPDWPATPFAVPLIEAAGAHPIPLRSADDHDAVMAWVSHGIHLASVSAMLAADASGQAADLPWRQFTGPAFRDVTRLAASHSGFWTSTLMANRDFVHTYIRTLQSVLEEFSRALEASDAGRLEQLLRDAARAHAGWREERP